MKSDSSIKRSVTPEKAIKMLAKEGLQINEKEAEEILDFLYFLAKLTVNQYVKNNKKIVVNQQIKNDKSTEKLTKINMP